MSYLWVQCDQCVVLCALFLVYLPVINTVNTQHKHKQRGVETEIPKWDWQATINQHGLTGYDNKGKLASQTKPLLHYCNEGEGEVVETSNLCGKNILCIFLPNVNQRYSGTFVFIFLKYMVSHFHCHSDRMLKPATVRQSQLTTCITLSMLYNNLVCTFCIDHKKDPISESISTPYSLLSHPAAV